MKKGKGRFKMKGMRKRGKKRESGGLRSKGEVLGSRRGMEEGGRNKGR